MALDYDDRIDFRAFDVLASAIENATPAELAHAIKSCSDIADNWDSGTNAHIRIKRLLFKGFANLMRLYLRKFNRRVYLAASTAKRAPIQARGL